ncbi:MAG TPA: crossover junction endodeoxyribonuclease RuvC [Saprospiraceae bacterium]|nr:crossover junction endodeoxyribonuclease RuvC [Saprospiraceae bacterium]
MNEHKGRILGIDPGTNLMGFAILDTFQNDLKVETIGVLNLKKLDDHQEKLREIFLQTQDLIEQYRPDIMAIEAPFFGKNVQSMLKLGRAQGVVIAAAILLGLEIHEYSPKKIKLSITGNGNAAKEQVAAMLCQILKITINQKHLDSSDALAVAVCHYNQNSGNKIGGKRYSGWASFVTDNKDRLK